MGSKPKSLVSSLCGYVTAVLTDVRYLYARPSDWERDHSRLIHELGIKGERLLTLDFPAIGKHLDRCLDQGKYTPSNLPLTGLVSKGVKVPAFLRSLYLLIFDRDGKLRSTPDLGAIHALRTLYTGVKKINLPYSERSLRHELKEFVSIEQALRSPSLGWDGDRLSDVDPGLYPEIVSDWTVSRDDGSRLHRILGNLHLADALEDRRDHGQLGLVFGSEGRTGQPSRILVETIQLVADIVFSSFGDLHDEDPSELPKHGPGVVSDVRRGESKYDFPFWTPKTEAIFPYDWYGTHTLGCRTFVRSAANWISHEVPSKIVAVPKTMKGPRLIAAEPSHHQWLQQLVMNQLVRRLESTPISSSVRFNDQTRNQKFALDGSIDGSYATIDLSSASDRVTCWLVERCARKNTTILERLHACRTRTAEWKGTSGQPSFRVKLRKFAPMGSACTFPVQSIIYCSVAIACILFTEGTRVSTKAIKEASARCSVFGDDIIVPKDSCAFVIQALEYLGLKVNATKTFSTGKFRESCGVDAWGGFDVTPPYLLDLSDHVRFSELPSYVAVVNNYFHKGFWRTSDWLLSRIPKHLIKMLPVTVNRDQACAIYSYSGVDRSRNKERFNQNLQRVEVFGAVVKNDSAKGPSSPASRLFQWFIEKPQPDTKWVSGVAKRKSSTTSSGWLPLDIISTRVNNAKVEPVGNV